MRTQPKQDFPLRSSQSDQDTLWDSRKAYTIAKAAIPETLFLLDNAEEIQRRTSTGTDNKNEENPDNPHPTRFLLGRMS